MLVPLVIEQLFFNEEAQIVSSAQKELTQYFPKAGWVEQDAEEIFTSVVNVMKEALKKAGLVAKDIAAI